MQIASMGSPSMSAITPRTAQPERAERGPDRDNDGDEGGAAVAAKSLPTPPPGRGGKVDMMA